MDFIKAGCNDDGLSSDEAGLEDPFVRKLDFGG